MDPLADRRISYHCGTERTKSILPSTGFSYRLGLSVSLRGLRRGPRTFGVVLFLLPELAHDRKFVKQENIWSEESSKLG